MKLRIRDDKKGRRQSWSAEVEGDDCYGFYGYGPNQNEAIAELKANVSKRITELQEFLQTLEDG